LVSKKKRRFVRKSSIIMFKTLYNLTILKEKSFLEKNKKQSELKHLK